jgi:peptidoglycan hydrolase-like protein with peptidoglycan-binding domain
MKSLLRHIVFFAVLLINWTILAQQKSEEVSFELKVSKERLGINERLRADFVMNRDGDNFVPPTFNGFRVLIGPSQSISSSWINFVRSFSKTYSYVLEPLEKGKTTIGQASIVIEGNTYKTIPVDITITEAVDVPGGPSSLDNVIDQNMHLVAEVSKSNPYLNEPISVVYKLYYGNGLNVSNFRLLDNPKYNNFWSQDIPISKYNSERGLYKDQPYNFYVLKRVVLYPQKSGYLDIEPLALEVTLNVPTDRRDLFGRVMTVSVNKNVSAGKRTIQVKPLPEAGKPEDFSGAVGAFNFKVETSRQALNASESLQAMVTISGKGNLKLFPLPKLNLPSSLEVYEPELKDNVRTNLNGMQGSISETYTIVPSFQGQYPIPAISFPYFNPETNRYERLNSEEITIQVLEGPTAAASNNTSPSEPKSVVRSNDQFYFLKLKPNLTQRVWLPFFGSQEHFLWLFGPLLLIPLFLIFRRQLENRKKDVQGLKVRRANRLAKKYLSKAKKELGEKDAFYVALEKALHNYLKARLHLETADFSKDKIRELLAQRGASDSSKNGFMELLGNCEMARYSPFSRSQMQQDYNKASEVITILDKEM